MQIETSLIFYYALNLFFKRITADYTLDYTENEEDGSVIVICGENPSLGI